MRISPPQRQAHLTTTTLRAMIQDMGTGPGFYTSHDLYVWYESMTREEGALPVSPKMFGMTLRQLGYKSRTQRVSGKLCRGWFITQRALREDKGTVVRSRA